MGYCFYLHLVTASTYKGGIKHLAPTQTISCSLTEVSFPMLAKKTCGANRQQTFFFFVISIDSCDSRFVKSLFKGLLHAILAYLLTISLLHSNLKFWNGWFFQRRLQIKQLSPTYAPITQHNTLEKKKLSLLTQGKNTVSTK